MILAEFFSGNAIRSHYGLGSNVFEQRCTVAKLGVLPNREALTRTTLYLPDVVESIKPMFFLITENLDNWTQQCIVFLCDQSQHVAGADINMFT